MLAELNRNDIPPTGHTVAGLVSCHDLSKSQRYPALSFQRGTPLQDYRPAHDAW
jgi:hypothetical protein